MPSSQSLPQVLQTKSPSLYNRYLYCKQIATSGFQQHATMIGYLTDHGPQHYANIETNLAQLLSEKEVGEDWQSIRREHVIRSFDYLDQYYADWGFNRFEAYALKYICLGHGGERLYQIPETQVIGRTQVRVRLLAALLRLADELDLDYTRVSRYIRQLKIIPADSLTHWLKHEAISGVRIDARSWTIEVHAMPETPEQKAIIDEMVGRKVQQELDYFRPIIEAHGLYYRWIDLVYTDYSARPGGVPSSAPKPSPSLPHIRQQVVYSVFDILVDSVQSDGSCAARVIESPAGQASAQMVPLKGIPVGVPVQAGAIKHTGIQLFDALFKDHIRDRFRESTGRLRENERMRIRLRVLSPELQRVPWEMLYDVERQEYLALSKRLSLVRYVHTPKPAAPIKHPTPLKLLVVISTPIDLAPLNAQQEEQKLCTALDKLVQQGVLEITVLSAATATTFRAALQHDVHLVHFIGHGMMSDDCGYLAFEHEITHSAAPMDAETLAVLLADTPVRFVFLNACESAATAQESLTGVAYRLVNAGVAAVVAMQFPVADDSAIVFASDFYSQLAQQLPLDECVSRAREAVMLTAGLDAPDWACPVLFTRAPDAHIFGA